MAVALKWRVIMLWPVSETIELIAPYLPGSLISAQAFSHIKTIATVLPNAMSGYFLECRLGVDNTRVDFLSCAMACKGGRTVLAGEHPPAALPAFLLQHPLWRRVQDFVLQWADTTSLLYQQVPLIWLEFDVDGPPPEVPLPSLLFCLDPAFLLRDATSETAAYLTAETYRHITETTVAHLIGQPLPPRTHQTLLACYERLPAGGHLVHISVMLARRPMVVKVNVSLPKDRFLAYLDRIEWRGSYSEMQALLTAFYPSTDIIKVDLTIADTVLPHIGLEFFSDPQDDPKRQELLHRCVNVGLCTPAKRDALFTWPGHSCERYAKHLWPTLLKRWLCVKLVYQSNAPLEAKGYLGFMPDVYPLFQPGRSSRQGASNDAASCKETMPCKDVAIP
jgi:hypothetical protein